MQLFTNYVLDQMVFAIEPSKKHAKRLAEPEDYVLLVCKAEDAPVKNYPTNSSLETLKELEFLRDLRASYPNAPELEEAYDDDMLWAFKEIIEAAGHKYDKEFFTRLMDEAGSIAIRLKYKYNRPRPFQIAASRCFVLVEDESETAKTPSFPSGHALQSTLTALTVGKLFPELAESAMKIADEVVLSRMVGGHHFPSDIKFGQEIGQWMFMHLKM